MNTFVVGRIVLPPKPLEGVPMPPVRPTLGRREEQTLLSRYAQEVSQIIGGHSFVQEWSEDKQAEFCMFVREVLRTVA